MLEGVLRPRVPAVTINGADEDDGEELNGNEKEAQEREEVVAKANDWYRGQQENGGDVEMGGPRMNGENMDEEETPDQNAGRKAFKEVLSERPQSSGKHSLQHDEEEEEEEDTNAGITSPLKRPRIASPLAVPIDDQTTSNFQFFKTPHETHKAEDSSDDDDSDFEIPPLVLMTEGDSEDENDD